MHPFLLVCFYPRQQKFRHPLFKIVNSFEKIFSFMSTNNLNLMFTLNSLWSWKKCLTNLRRRTLLSGEYTGCNHVRFLMTKFLYAVIILQQRHRRIRRCSYYLWAGCFVKRSRHRFILQSVPHTWKKHYCAKVYTISVLYSLDNGIVDLTITFISM